MTRLISAVILSTALISGCAYKVPVQQGNIIEQEAVDQLRFGMTRSQVLFLMGNPLIDDPMHVHRWDYVYFRKVGGKQPQLRRVTLKFNPVNGKLVSVEQVPDYGTRINRLEEEQRG